MRTYRVFTAFALFFLSSILFSCRNTEHHDHATEKEEVKEDSVVALSSAQMKTARVQFGQVEQRQISGTIKANGVLDVPPQQLVSISVPLGGFLKQTTLLQGSKVRRGQVVATVENMDFIQLQQDYVEAKSQFELAKADFERQQELASENVNSQKTLQQSRTNYTTWLAKYNGLREKLKVLAIDLQAIDQGIFTSTIKLYSPIDGYVTEVNGNIGKYISPTDVLFKIVDTDHLHAELTLFEKDIHKLKIGQKVRILLANETTERLASVYLINREISINRTIRVHCHIDKEDKDLLPGTYLTAFVETGGELGTVLPSEAIVDYQGKKYIFVPVSRSQQENTAMSLGKNTDLNGGDEKQYFRMLKIETGNSELGYTEVKLPENLAHTEIVVKGAYSILSKMKNREEED
jgi:membrane fusion protein, heavy metal efflux system